MRFGAVPLVFLADAGCDPSPSFAHRALWAWAIRLRVAAEKVLVGRTPFAERERLAGSSGF